MKGWLVFSIIILVVGIAFAGKVTENVFVDFYRIRKDKISQGEINSIKAMGRNNSRQPFQITEFLTPTDTTYFLIRISTLTPSESSHIDKLIEKEDAKLYQRFRQQVIFSNQIGGSYKQAPQIEVDNSALYPVDYDWSVCRSSPCP